MYYFRICCHTCQCSLRSRTSGGTARQSYGEKNQEPKTLFKLLTFFCFCAAPRSGLPGLASRKRVQSYALIPNPPNFSARKYAIKHIFNIRLQIVHRTESPPQAPNTLISRNINHKTRQPRQNAAPAAKKHRTPIIPSEKKSATPKKTPAAPTLPAQPFNIP